MEYTGLSTAEVNENRKRFGFNELPEKKRSLILLFLRQFKNILVYILGAALVLSLILPFLEQKSPTIENFSDALVIVAILLLNAILGFVQEFRAEKALSALKVLSAANARVRRNGEETIIPARELVPGDIVILVNFREKISKLFSGVGKPRNRFAHGHALAKVISKEGVKHSSALSILNLETLNSTISYANQLGETWNELLDEISKECKVLKGIGSFKFIEIEF